MLLQLGHMIDHEEIHHCDATGFTKHFHEDSDNHCAFLHQELSFHYTYPTAFLAVPRPLESFTKRRFLSTQINTQILPYASLRAPPTAQLV